MKKYDVDTKYLDEKFDQAKNYFSLQAIKKGFELFPNLNMI